MTPEHETLLEAKKTLEWYYKHASGNMLMLIDVEQGRRAKEALTKINAAIERYNSPASDASQATVNEHVKPVDAQEQGVLSVRQIRDAAFEEAADKVFDTAHDVEEGSRAYNTIISLKGTPHEQ